MSKKQLSNKKMDVVVPPAPKRVRNPKGVRLLRGIMLFAAFAVAIISWAYRLFDLGTIIGNGGMSDLAAYYRAAQSMLTHQPIWVIGESAPFGPPLTLIPFLPLLALPLVLAQFTISLLNVLLYVLAWYLIAKRFAKRFSLTQPSWWVGLAVMAWSFPISYSLGAGNPMGMVTWGIISYLVNPPLLASIGLILAISLKFFPVILLSLITKKRADVVKATAIIAVLTILMLVSFWAWPSQWSAYSAYASHLGQLALVRGDAAAQNQSFMSALLRLGVVGSWLTASTLFWSGGLLLLVGLWIISEKPWKKMTSENRLQWGMRLLATLVLIHPMPWQYYHALFMPYILLRLVQKRFAYLPVLLLLSFNAGWLPASFPGMPLLASSQWLGTFLLIIVEFSLSKKTSINQIIKDRSFFNRVSPR